SSSVDAAAGTTTVLLGDNPPEPPLLRFLILPLTIFATVPLKLTTTRVHDTVIQKTWSHADLLAQTKVQKWSLPALKLNLKWQLFRFLLPVEKGVFAFRQKAAVFGHN